MRTSSRVGCGAAGPGDRQADRAGGPGTRDQRGHAGQLVRLDRRQGEGALAESEREELRRLRKENAELRMRCDVLKRSAALWAGDAMRR
jgi:hypothetical protein